MKRIHTIFSLSDFQQETPTRKKSRIERREPTTSPRESVIRTLLSYSLALTVLQTSHTGILTLVMN